MPSLNQTWSNLLAIRTLMTNEFVVPYPTGTSPLNTFSNADCTQQGVANGSPAIYVGEPKFGKTNYKYQLHVIPPHPDHSTRHALGGKIWAEQVFGLVLLYNATQNEHQVLQDICNAADAMHAVLGKHARLPGQAIVVASHEVDSGVVPSGYFIDERLGREFYCWGFDWWLRSEWFVPSGIID